MGLSLGSQELADECFRRQEEDPEFQKKLEGLEVKLLMVCNDCPGNEDRQLGIVFEDGRLIEILVEAKAAPSDLRTAPFDHTKYEFRVQAPQDMLIDMISGKMDMIQALPVVKIEGDIAKLMAKAEGFINFIKFLGTMDIVP
jgi:putative sterol carrier protein